LTIILLLIEMYTR